MKLIKSTVAALASISYASIAQAQDGQNKDSGAYGAIGASAYVTDPSPTFNVDLFTADLKLGYNFNKYFGVEAQGSLGLNTDSFDVPINEADPETASLRNKVDYSVAALGVARLPLTEQFSVYARGGVHNTQVSRELITSDEVFDTSRTKTGIAVGAGAQFNFDEKNGIRADYTYLDGTNGETLSLGYVRKF